MYLYMKLKQPNSCLSEATPQHIIGIIIICQMINSFSGGQNAEQNFSALI